MSEEEKNTTEQEAAEASEKTEQEQAATENDTLAEDTVSDTDENVASDEPASAEDAIESGDKQSAETEQEAGEQAKEKKQESKNPTPPSISQRPSNRGTRKAAKDDKKSNSHRGGRGRSRNRGRGRDTEKKEYDEEVLRIARVTRVVKGGRRLRFQATVVIGNKKGKVGLGTGKSTEVASAIRKAVASAHRNLIEVPTENGTIPHELKWKHKSARILLMPATEGTGIIAGGALRKIADLAGIENILGKSYGTNNTLVNAQAMMQALQAFRKGKIVTEGENEQKKAKEAPKKEAAEKEKAPAKK